jgi:hypothetical protein
LMRVRLLVAALAVLLGSGGIAGATSGHVVRRAACPMELLPLGANAIGPASTVALAAEHGKSDPQVRMTSLAPYAGARGSEAKFQCGTAVWRRTVVVFIHLRAFDRGPNRSASLAERVDWVGRFANGYGVWEFVH